MTHDSKILFAEIGQFIVEFEGLMQRCKETIQNYFENEELNDTIPIEMLMYDSVSSSLANYFKAISLYLLDKKHADKKINDIEAVKKYIFSITAKIIEAGELRNDIVHSTWQYSSFYGTNIELAARRIKISNRGAVARNLSVKPGKMDDSVWMINRLGYLMQRVGEVITSDELRVDFLVEEEDITKIDFRNEKDKLFVEDENHYKNIHKEREELKSLFGR